MKTTARRTSAMEQSHESPAAAPAASVSFEPDQRSPEMLARLQSSMGNAAVQAMADESQRTGDVEGGALGDDDGGFQNEPAGDGTSGDPVEEGMWEILQDEPRSPEPTEGFDPGPRGKKGPKVRIEMRAFIPGKLGKAFKKFAHPTGLANQQAYDKQVASVSGTWAEEPQVPGVDWLTDGIQGTNPWCFHTDGRGFGGAREHSRLYTIGTLDTDNLDKSAFKTNCGMSQRVRTNVDGLFSKTGEVESESKRSKPQQKVQTSTPHVEGSEYTVQAFAGYPFAMLAPDIDYTLSMGVSVDANDRTVLDIDALHNKFPYYELLVNGKSVYTWAAPGETGPGLWNLGFAWHVESLKPIIIS